MGSYIEYDDDGIIRELIFVSEDEVLFTPSLSDACEGTKFIYCWGAETNPAEDYHLGDNSPCVDARDPSDLYSDEPVPNGGRINLGAFGGTSEATTSLDVNGDNNIGLEEVVYILQKIAGLRN